MSKTALFLFFLLLPACFGNKLNYEVGSTISYSLHTVTDTKGFAVDTNEQTSGSTFTFTGTVVMNCIDKDEESFVLAVNVKDSVISVDSNTEDDANDNEASVEDWLGEDMFFQQHEQGQIMRVWYNDTEDPFILGVKIGIINSLQTNLATQEKLQITEHDALGQHKSVYTRELQGRNSMIKKKFSEVDFFEFADDDIQQHNVKVDGQSSALLGNSGVLHSISSIHKVTFDNVAEAPLLTAFNDDTSATDSIDVKFISYGTTKLVLNEHQRGLLYLSPLIPRGLASGSLFEVAASIIDIQESTSVDDIIPIEKDVTDLVDSQDVTQSVLLAKKITDKIINDKTQSKKFVRHVLSKNLTNDINALSKVLPILAQLENREAKNLLYQILWSNEEQLQMLAIQSMSIATEPPASWASTLWNLYSTSSSETVKNMAILAAGTIIKKTKEESIAKSIRSKLSNAVESGDFHTARLFTHVVNNAELHLPQELHSNLTMLFADANYPFAKSWNGQSQLGGSSINLKGTVEVMSGTNFNCKQSNFNYKVFGQAEAIGTLFGHSKTAFHAHAVYGKANGSPLENEILVKAWNSVLYHKTLPSLDCNEHTYPLAHTAPGFDVKYTIFVSVVPVTFSAGANLVFDLHWGWQVCDAQLGALIELIPKTTLVVHGAAEINLLLIKGGIQLTGSFNLVIRPQGYIHGSMCALGFQVLEQNEPMNVNLLAYYQTRHCRLLKLKCSWGGKHSTSILHFNVASNQKTLYKQEFAIKK